MAAERTSSPLDPVSVLRDQELRMTDNRFANGDRVLFEGETYTVTGVEANSARESRVRLDAVNSSVRRWVDAALVDRVDAA